MLRPARHRTLAVVAGSCALAAACGRLPSLPAGVEVAVRGHEEGFLDEGGRLTPLFLGWSRQLGLCLSSPEGSQDRSWQARLKLDGRFLSERFEAPALQVGSTQCFEAPSTVLPATGEPVELCGEARDAWSGERFGLPCQRLRRAQSDLAFRAALSRFDQVIGSQAGLAFSEWLAENDRARREIEALGAPFQALRLAVIAINECTTRGELAEARRRLERLPAWLAQPAASHLSGQAQLEAAQLELEAAQFENGPRLERAWALLKEAERDYLRVADPYWFLAAKEQARILGAVGAVSEAAARLAAALGDCERAPCGVDLVPAARAQLAWLRLLDPDADDEALVAAGRDLERALGEPPFATDAEEAANLWINLAYLAARRGQDAQEELGRAHALLAPLENSERKRFLLGWTELVAGRGALAAGDATRALAHCAAGAGTARALAPWLLSCQGAAHRRLGSLAEAAGDFEQALLFHELAAGDALDQNVALGPGQRADDFYQAARVAVELGQPAEGWALLARLDELTAREDERDCRARAGGVQPAAWAASEQQRRQLLAELDALSGPASRRERERLEPIVRSLKERLQELARRVPPCSSGGAGSEARPMSPPEADYRAAALEDEILLLHRKGDGQVTLARRTALPRRELARRVSAIRQALDQHTLEDAAWRELTAPLAAALVPSVRASFAPVLSFALHGLLQGVPLAALPAGDGFLADRVTVVLRTAMRPRATRNPGADPRDERARAFVVDPRTNLPTGPELARFYRQRFPAALVLSGAAATRPALERLAPLAWLHVDAHGQFDASFPELSSLELADGALRASELAALVPPAVLVNLSGCRTGRWPTTADSGRFGLGGLFLRLGTPWVVATAGDLDDLVARDFNFGFYSALAEGRTVPESYRVALAQVRGRHPAAAWGGLMLLAGQDSTSRESGGQSAPLGTPEHNGRGAVPGSVLSMEPIQ